MQPQARNFENERTPGHVTMDPAVYFPSTWRTEVGAPLTSRRITMWERRGFYGLAKKAMALRRHLRKKKAQYYAPNGIICRCVDCGSQEFVTFRKWDYLPKPGYYCLRCIDIHRAERDKDKGLRRQFLERIKAEYV